MSAVRRRWAARAIAVDEVSRGDVRATRDTCGEVWSKVLEAKCAYGTAGTLEDYAMRERERRE